ncbi:formate/nitrite transporter family protein [Nitrospiraceae bacterium HYJII51-Mn-bac16s-1-B09]|uniref:Formate/nitrite transporter family protein n=1 Tax=Candidatus Manganitrophus noduliformans TaxID=2606439 RepID=A0A7X6DR11_9BACT|nr:formate/nitrite transporter family protein [Candidatus Manganitrophus noduliformans]
MARHGSRPLPQIQHSERRNALSDEEEQPAPEIRDVDRAASGGPRAGWAIGDRFSWEEIHQRLLASADEEISSSVREMFFSGFTAGFAIALTFVAYAVGRVQFPENRFLAALLYPIGFLYIILGRYQLFTENTLPPVKLVMTRLASLPLLLRLWGVVLIANIAGAALGAYILAHTHVLSPDAIKAGATFAQQGFETGRWWDAFFKAVFAGWLVAGVVWINVAARDTISRLVIVYIVFYMVAVADLFHVITAAADLFFFVFLQAPGPGLISLVHRFWLPVLLGNTVGGVMLFAFSAYAQTEQRRYPEVRILTLRELLFSMKGGRPFKTPRPRPPWKKGS